MKLNLFNLQPNLTHANFLCQLELVIKSLYWPKDFQTKDMVQEANP
jgi:hypothetical protein